jgi:hypothetical protein
MKPARLLILFLWCCAAASAQSSSGVAWDKNPTADSGPVALKDEPHHRLIFQNDSVHVYDVEVSAENSTLLHHHDLPYILVALGQAGFTNSIQGKPGVHVSLQDSEAKFETPPVVHLVKVDSGMDFHDITVEFTKPQNAAHNLCMKLMDGPLDCPANSSTEQETAAKSAPKLGMKKAKASAAPVKSGAADPPPADSQNGLTSGQSVPYFETDQVRVDLVKVSGARYGGLDYKDAAPKQPALVIAMENSSLSVDLGNQRNNFLHGGDVMWLPAGARRAISDFLGESSTFLLISFKDAGT